MNILAINALSHTLVVALQSGQETFSLSFEGRGHTERVVVFIQELLHHANISVEMLDIIACPAGPGSFSGLRLGYATAKALQLAHNTSFVAIPSLDLVCKSVDTQGDQMLALIDAKRNRFYARLITQDTTLSDADVALTSFIPYLNKEKPLFITGLDLSPLKAHIQNAFSDYQILFFDLCAQQCTKTLLTYAPTYACQADYASPLYIRKSDAEGDAHE